MDLETYIAETLKQIVGGIITAQQSMKDKRTVINPHSIVESGGLYCEGDKVHNPRTVHIIHYEVSIGQMKGTETKGGIGVFLANVGIGAQGKTESTSNAINTIKFSIPVIYPSN
jgi:hypothetical protein